MAVLATTPAVTAPKRRAHILVTDDRPRMVGAIRAALAGHYECEFAEDLGDARVMLTGGVYDLVICDTDDSTGAAMNLAEEIVKGGLDTAVILVAEEDDPDLAKRAFDFGAYGYVVTPPWPGQLLMTVMNALRRQELELANREHSQNIRDQSQAILDRAPMPVYAKDLSGHYVLANAMADELAGVKRGEMLGLTDAAIMNRRGAMRSARVDREVAERGEIFEATESLMVGGTPRTFKTVKFPLRDEDGKITAVSGISTDVTAELEAMALRDQLLDVQAQAIEELELSRHETIEGLTQAIELHDSSTGEHIHRMAAIAALLGTEIGLDPGQVDLLRVAAPMHDVGKIGVSREMLQKPGPLSPAERRSMELHTLIGQKIFAGFKSELSRTAGSIAATHHERFDGSGYPRGLSGEEIPIEGRVTAVADVFDALLTDRSYRPALPLDEAVAIIRDGKGTHFDPLIVDALLDHLDAALAIRGD